MDTGERSLSEQRLNSTLMDSVCKSPPGGVARRLSEEFRTMASEGVLGKEARSLGALCLLPPSMSDLEKLLKRKSLLVP